MEREDKMENCHKGWELLWVQAAGLCTPSWWGFSVSRDRRCPGRHLTVRGCQELEPVRGEALYRCPSKPRGDPARWLLVYSQSYFSFQGHESHTCSLKPETDLLARRHHTPWLGVTRPGTVSSLSRFCSVLASLSSPEDKLALDFSSLTHPPGRSLSPASPFRGRTWPGAVLSGPGAGKVGRGLGWSNPVT